MRITLRDKRQITLPAEIKAGFGKDAPVMAAALAGGAHFLCTGDNGNHRLAASIQVPFEVI